MPGAHADVPPSRTPIDLERRAARAWRIALVAYLVPLTVATHWPRLGFGGGGEIDKFVHFLGFGVAAWAWMHARPFGSAVVGFLVAAAWVYLDERTQALEVLGRTFSLHDMVAGWIGVAMAGGIFAAHRAQSPVDDREIRALAHADGRAWAIAALVTVASIVVLGLATLVFVQKGPEPRIAEILYSIGFGGYLGVILAAALLWRRARTRVGRPALQARASSARSLANALVTLVLAGLLLGLYLLLAWLLFGTEVPDDLRLEHAGFRVLIVGYLVSAVLVAALTTSMLVARLAPARGGTARHGGG